MDYKVYVDKDDGDIAFIKLKKRPIIRLLQTLLET